MLKWDYVNRTCCGCGRKLRMVAQLRNGKLMLQCQDTERIKGLKADRRCPRRNVRFVVDATGLVVDENPNYGPGCVPMDNDDLVGD